MKFTERYQQDEKYRENHLEYMREKIACGCGKKIARCSFTAHRRSKKHQLWLEQQTEKIKELKKKIKKLEPAIEELKSLKRELRRLK